MRVAVTAEDVIPAPVVPPSYKWMALANTTVGVVLLGAAYMVLARPYERGNAPAGDAHLLGSAAGRRASAVAHG